MQFRRWIVAFAAIFAGGASMVIELASVRALAPYFGASTEIWTTAIGVILFALACGYAVGGVVAERPHPARNLGISLAISGALASSAPLTLPWLAAKLLPPDLSLGDAIPILRGGALIAEFTIFSLPVFLLGFANPLFVKSMPGAEREPGRAAGWILAMSTLGGLGGTFGTTYWLIPELGVRMTLFGCGAALGILGLIFLMSDRAWKQGTLLLFLIGGSGALASSALGGPMKPARAFETLLAEVEGREQYLRVVETNVNNPETNPARERWLQVSECLDSFQSMDAPNRKTPGHYYDVLAAAALFSGVDRSADICIIGAGTGSVVRSISEMCSEPRVDAVELDAAIVQLARKYFRLDDFTKIARVHTAMDGRVALRHLPGVAESGAETESEPASKTGSAPSHHPRRYDAILMDAYARQVEIPFHLVTREMFLLCKQKLADGGIVAINVSSFGASDPVLRSIASTLSSVFAPGETAPQNVAVLRVRGDHNSIVIARKDAALPTAARFLKKVRELGLEPLTLVAQFLAGPGGMELYKPSPADVLLTDDRAPMEKLQALSLQLASAQAK